MSESVVILDFGSQYTQLIARRIRELEVHSVLLPGDCTLDEIKNLNPKGIIMSGGPSSVTDENAPRICEGFYQYLGEKKLPVLGICYGMQLMVHDLGGKVRQSTKREYGRQEIKWSYESKDESKGESSDKGIQLAGVTQNVWMSHGDDIMELPQGFVVTARSVAMQTDHTSPEAMSKSKPIAKLKAAHGSIDLATIAAIENREKKWFALQFHPEVTHTEKGIEILSAFLNHCNVKRTWTAQSIIENESRKISDTVGEHDHVICALSGGVDSVVAAVLAHRVLKDRLHCIFVDNGLLRFDEGNRVMAMFQDRLHLSVKRVDASSVFLSRLSGVSQPEEKRKIIGDQFIKTFRDEALKISNDVGKIGGIPKYLIQGTLYPDVIESFSSAGAKGEKVTIKTHHNVGGLPKDLPFQLIEPLRMLFKDEVRRLGRQLGIPEDFLMRHPFPGPGLGIRMPGAVDKESLDILRQVDEVYIDELRLQGLYNAIWQAFAVLLPVKSVGVQGDGRTHERAVVLRAVTSVDGMTADWFRFDYAVLEKISTRICNDVKGVNRVLYDISSKPPATIEWE